MEDKLTVDEIKIIKEASFGIQTLEILKQIDSDKLSIPNKLGISEVILFLERDIALFEVVKERLTVNHKRI